MKEVKTDMIEACIAELKKQIDVARHAKTATSGIIEYSKAVGILSTIAAEANLLIQDIAVASQQQNRNFSELNKEDPSSAFIKDKN